MGQTHSYAGAMRPSVFRCCFLAPYVPLRAECSESVPAMEIIFHAEEKSVPAKNALNPLSEKKGVIHMAKRGGFPGGGMGMPGNMNNLMKQAQRMQRQMEESQKELETKEFTAKAGGGAVEVTVSGKKEIVKVILAQDVVDPDDVEMLQDLIVAATNEALRMAEEASANMMNKMTGGLGGLTF